jgi:hypothetical protein
VHDTVTLAVSDLGDQDDDGVPATVRVRLEVTHLDGRRVDRIRLHRIGPPGWGDDE